MSIIADTLKRLQTQSEEPPPKPQADMGSRPALNISEGSGRHRKDSPFGFLMVMVGMTITLGGLAVTAFWLGGHLDFGLATNTQARVNDDRSLPHVPDLFEDQEVLDHTSNTHVRASPEPTPFPQSPTTPSNKEQQQASKVLHTDNAPIPPSPPHGTPTPSPFEGDPPAPSPTKAIVVTASPDQHGLSPTRDQLSSEKEESRASIVSVSEEPSAVINSAELPISSNEYPATENMNSIDQTDDPEAPKLVAMSLEEETIQTEEFVKSRKPLIDSPPRATTLAALEARRESMNHDVRATVPLQPSPAKRLRHAQHLIRSEKYEDAVALLSPLFHDPPVKWQPWFWMGTALLGKGDMEQADQFFLSGLARNDKVPQLWIQRALVAQQRGDFQLAIHELRQAESIEADIPHIHLNMGYAYERLGNDRLANQYYEKFLKLSEGQPTFFSTRKKLFARLTQQTPTKNPSPPSSPKP